jgi:H+/Cl- antiporter ClcA
MQWIEGINVQWRVRAATLCGAALIGLGALAFTWAADRSQIAFGLIEHALHWWLLIVIPLAYGTAAWITRRWFAAASGSGIPQVIATARRHGEASARPLISLSTTIAKTVLTCALLCFGAPIGREGPTVQLAASVNAAVHRWLRVPLTSGILIAGGAAGVAAAFNTPIAGISFAIEELAAAYEQRVAMLVMMTVMIAGFVSLGIAGDYVYLGTMAARLSVPTVLTVIPVAGVIGGLFGGIFSRLMLAVIGPGGGRLSILRKRPILLAIACGLVVAAMGLLSGGSTWGTGYATTKLLVEGASIPWWLTVERFFATLATAWSGTPGGIFAPSLSLGAELGGVIGGLWPHAPLGPIVLLGMIAYFTGVVRAPLTAVIIVSETTAARAMIIPLFATAIIADAVSGLICRERLYHSLSRNFLPRKDDHQP